MKAKLIVVLLIPFLASGCMMAGMAAMGGVGPIGGGRARRSGDAELLRQPSVIKEVTSGAVRVRVEFPPVVPGDSLRYDVTVLDRDGRAVTDDAAIFLDVSLATGNGIIGSPAQAHSGHPPKIAHGSSDGLEGTRIAPVERSGGRYVFRPTIPVDGAYRLALVVERVGDAVLEPPMVVEHIAQVLSTAPAAPPPAHSPGGGGRTPLVMLGAGFMAVMMLAAIR